VSIMFIFHSDVVNNIISNRNIIMYTAYYNSTDEVTLVITLFMISATSHSSLIRDPPIKICFTVNSVI